MLHTVVKRVRLYWRLFWLFRQLHLMRMFEYRASFWFWAVVSLVWSIFNYFFFSLISGPGQTIGGWTMWEMYLLLSVFTIIDTFVWSFFYNNMSVYTNAIFSGELSQWLLRPVDPQFLLMTHNNNYSNVFRFGFGVAMLVVSLQQLQLPLSFGRVAGFTLVLTCSLLLVYALWFSLSTLAFYVERLNNLNDIIPSLRRAWQVPRSVYTGVFSFMFTVAFPVGLAGSIPAEYLLGELPGRDLVFFLAITLFSLVFSRWFFFFSVRRYAGAGG